MADNTTTYKAVIETEVKGQKEVDDYNKSLEEGGDKFKSLRTQIRETTVKLQELADQGKEGTKQFKQLSDELDDLGDKQKRVAFQSGQIEDKLAALPGPIGQIGKGFASAKDAVDTFGKGLAVATGGITLIIGAVLAMKEAMGKTKEGQETLNKVSEAFGKIMAPIFALFEKIGIPIFNKVAEVLGWLGDKLTALLTKLGITPAKINEIASEGNKAFYDAAQTDLENAKKVADLQKQQDEENKRKALERKQKYLEQQAELQKEADEKEKRDLQNQLDILERLKKKMAGKTEPIGTDGLTATQREKLLKQEEDRKKFFAEKMAKNTEGVQKKLADGTIKLATSTALTIEAEDKDFAAKKIINDKKTSEEKKKAIQEDLVAATAALSVLGAIIDQNSVAGKAIAVAQAIINTYQGATKALAQGGILGAVAAAAVVAAGLINVQKIISTEVPKMNQGSASASSSGGISAPSIATPAIQTPTFNESSLNIGGNNPTTQIANTLAQTTGKPIRAYVVSTDVSSQQALDRRTNIAATF